MMAVIAITLLSAISVIAASTMPSSSFTIGEGAEFSNFDVTGAQRDIHLTAGLAYEITCEAGTIPGLVDQRWYKDGSAVEKRNFGFACSSQTEVFYSNEVDNNNRWVLKFCNFQTTLAGSFTCRPSLDYNKTLIISEGNPSVIVEKDIISSVDFGSGTTVGIFLSGMPTPAPANVTWLFDGVMFGGFGPPGVTITDVGGLVFNLFSIVNAGRYTCIVTTSAGVGMDSFRVQIRAPPVVSLTVEYNLNLITSGPIEVLQGANLTLSCIDSHAFPLPSFQWFSNGTEITNTNLSTTVKTIGNNQSQLALYNVQEGSFTLKCTATNSEGSQSRMITVSVLNLPSLTLITPQETSRLVGNNLTLLLIFNGGHIPLTAKWRRNTTSGMHEMIAEGGRVILDGQHSINLTLTNLALSDAGMYELNVTNQIGSSIFMYTVLVYEPPTVENISPLTTSIPPNSSYTITARITEGSPAVQATDVVWSTTPSTQGSPSFNGSVASLYFTNLSSPVLVNLTVQHPSGHHTLLFNISIQRPDAGNCSSVNVLPRQVTLIWVWSQDQLMVLNLNVTEYSLNCPHNIALTTSATTINITTGIVPYTNYTCTLTAITNLGIFPFSACIFETPQDIPSDSPENVQIMSSMTSVKLQWQPPAQPNGIITRYKILSIDTQETVILNSSITRYTFCGLQSGQQMSYNISASTVAGEGPTVNIITTTQDETFSGVEQLKVSFGEINLNVIWSPPVTPHGFITQYIVIVVNNETEVRPAHRSETMTTSSYYLITQLNFIFGVPYYITVLPLDDCNTYGDPTNIVIFSKQLSPTVIVMFTTNRSGDGTEVFVSWQPVTLEQARGFFVYRVIITPVVTNNKRQSAIIRTVSRNETSVTVSRLDSSIPYTVNVVVVNENNTELIGPTRPPLILPVKSTTVSAGLLAGVIVPTVCFTIGVVLIVIVVIIVLRSHSKRLSPTPVQEEPRCEAGIKMVKCAAYTTHHLPNNTAILAAEVNATLDSVQTVPEYHEAEIKMVKCAAYNTHHLSTTKHDTMT